MAANKARSVPVRDMTRISLSVDDCITWWPERLAESLSIELSQLESVLAAMTWRARVGLASSSDAGGDVAYRWAARIVLEGLMTYTTRTPTTHERRLYAQQLCFIDLRSKGKRAYGTKATIAANELAAKLNQAGSDAVRVCELLSGARSALPRRRKNVKREQVAAVLEK